MDKTKFDKQWIDLLAKQMVIDVADWMGGVNLQLSTADGRAGAYHELHTVYGQVDGDLKMQMRFAADKKMLSRMSEKLFGAPPENREELEEYMVEYANVLFGRFISEICRDHKPRLRFHAPRYEPSEAQTPFNVEEDRSSDLYFISDQQELSAFSWAVEDYFEQI